MNIDSKHLQTLLDPLGLDEPMNRSFVRIAYRVTLVIFAVEAAVEIALPLLMIMELFQ